MKHMRFKLLALGLSLVVGLTSVAVNPVGALAKENKSGKYPTEWDLTLLYKSEDEWNADYEKADKLLDEVEKYRGTLNTAQNIYDYFQHVELGEFMELFKKLETYAGYGTDLDAADAKFIKMNGRVSALREKYMTVTAFAEPEIFQMSLDERKKIFSDPIFKDMQYYLRTYTDPDYKVFTEDENVILATYEGAQGNSEKAFNILKNVEIPDPLITMPDGTEQELTSALYDDIVYSKDYDDEFKVKANENF